jgi:hypothetical protein
MSGLWLTLYGVGFKALLWSCLNDFIADIALALSSLKGGKSLSWFA